MKANMAKPAFEFESSKGVELGVRELLEFEECEDLNFQSSRDCGFKKARRLNI